MGAERQFLGGNVNFGSVCSGIEAASVAWGPLGWRAAWFAEIEPFPSAVLAHHYPNVSNVGDMTALPERIRVGEISAPDILCGGTPCQAFSVAGKRQSLADARGNLSLTFCDIADAIDDARSLCGLPAAIIFWENVPGVLSTRDNAFGCFLAQLCGGDLPLDASDGWPDAGCVSGPKRTAAWRVLDAQYFGLAQRRRRVFVVASARDGFDPAAVLFEWDGVRRDTAPSREAGKVAPTIPARSTGGGGLGTDFDLDGGLLRVSGTLTANTGGMTRPAGNANELDFCVPVSPTLRAGGNRTGGDRPPGTDVDTADSLVVTHSLRGEGFDASEDGTGLGTSLVPVGVFQDSEFGVQQYDSAGTLRAGRIPEHQMVLQPAIAWDEELNASVEQAGTLLRGGDGGRHDGVAVPIAFPPTQDPISSTEVCHSIGANDNATAAVAVRDTSPTITSNYGKQVDSSDTALGPNVVFPAMQVRRLTPRECERLQGFPDGYTAIPWRKKSAEECPDGPRYKALGNSWAVPVVRWIGERINRAVYDR